MKLIKDRRLDYQLLYQLQEDSVHVLKQQAHEEEDPYVKKALLKVIKRKYEEMLQYIDFGANKSKKTLSQEIVAINEEIKKYENI